MNAIDVVINEGMQGTIELETKELQCTSYKVFTTCRRHATLKACVTHVWQVLHLRAAGDIPRKRPASTPCSQAAGDHDWSESKAPAHVHARPRSSRITAGKTSKRGGGIERRLRAERLPHIRSVFPRGLVWRQPASKLAGLDLTGLRFLQLGRNDNKMAGRFNESLASFVLPPNLEVLRTGFHYDQPVQGVQWPESLKEVYFGCKFNQRIDGVLWPLYLEKLEFDPVASLFNEATKAWPASLTQLTLGQKFDQPLCGLPLNLQRLRVGRNFDKPIDGVAWPVSLKEIQFGTRFNQPIEGVLWPASLEEMDFGACFNQPIVGVMWPASLKKIYFGRDFEQQLDEIRFPAHAEVTVRGISFPHKNAYALA